MASQYLARLGIVLGIDSGELVQGITDAKKQFHDFRNQVEKDTKAAAREFEALKTATEDYGKTLTKVEQVQREIERGRFMFASQNVKDKLLQQAKAYDAQAAAMKKVNGVMTEQQKMQVGYQVTDFVTQVASGQNALISFIQQGGQLKDTMGGVGNAIRAITSLFTPFTVAAGAAAAVFGVLGLALYKSDEEFDKLKDSLTLTGNFAGITTDKFFMMSRALKQDVGVSIGSAKDIMQALISSGRFTEQTMVSVGKAIASFSKVSGVSADEAAKTLIPAFDGSAASAKRLNDQYHFLTIEQYKQIEALERQGRTQESARLTAEAFNKSIEENRRALGFFERTWSDLKKAASDAWEAMLGLGRPEQTIDALERVNAQVVKTMESIAKRKTLGMNAQLLEADLAKQQAEFQRLIEKIVQESEAAAAKGAGAQEQGGAISMWEKAGGRASQIKFAEEAAQIEIQARFKARIASASEESRIEIELEQKKALALQEERKRNEETFNQFTGEMAKIRAAKIAEAESEAEQKRIDLRKKRFIQELDAEIAALRNAEEKERELNQKKIDAERNAYMTSKTAEIETEFQRQRLDLQVQMIGATEKQLKLAELRLETEKQIALWKKSEEYGLLSEKDQQFYEQQMRLVADAKANNLELAESLRYVQGMYDAVWSNMSSAIEQFVRTGKLSIKDFTRSVIQDMLIMNMKLQAMTLVRGLLASFLPQAMGPVQGAQALGPEFNQYLQPKAAGGPVSGGSPYLIGERGPELFVPSGSGTIVPNHMLANNAGVTNVTNNYINAIDAKSFEQRLLESNQAIWSANQYAAKNLSTNFGRT